ncbi:hypothetical protein BDV98DRAFT_356159 [Pterulicium gracile]|uniref:Uncharacterized protein n=1 Tax=Pterulicium gracile TaxID=1884261 RepID=A0A5C3QPV0_9AGAR|nr:hypothetical protein BDV98DRAFT_356159 [Pterula gracilis]
MKSDMAYSRTCSPLRRALYRSALVQCTVLLGFSSHSGLLLSHLHSSPDQDTYNFQ